MSLLIFFFISLVSSVSASTPVNTISLNSIQLPLFILLGSLSLILIGLAVYSRSMIMATIGLFILLLLGFFLLNGKVEIPTGETQFTYGNITSINETGLLSEQKVYAPWDDSNSSLLGFFMIFGVVGLFMTLYWSDD